VSYRNLEIWQLARDLTIDIHRMTLQLPKYEMYEEASQIRRSMKSVRSNIVEGYGRRRYKNDHVRFIIYALSSNDETVDHLEMLYETGSLKDKELFYNLRERIQKLGIKINNFLQAIEKVYYYIKLQQL
jgi:four helix bundle protein